MRCGGSSSKRASGSGRRQALGGGRGGRWRLLLLLLPLLLPLLLLLLLLLLLRLLLGLRRRRRRWLRLPRVLLRRMVCRCRSRCRVVVNPRGAPSLTPFPQAHLQLDGAQTSIYTEAPWKPCKCEVVGRRHDVGKQLAGVENAGAVSMSKEKRLRT